LSLTILNLITHFKGGARSFKRDKRKWGGRNCNRKWLLGMQLYH